MKRDDLFTKLHDQYNTFTFTLQDPEAFHHDVYEISRDADTADEFHRLMADRQRQRLAELHESLESLAVEIIANPKLMDSEHWQYALQLFRTKSFDSIVRYFASYLPDTYLDQQDAISISSSFSETNSVKTESTTASSVDDAPITSFFGGNSIMTKEPLSIHSSMRSSHLEAPLSPPSSEATPDEEAVASSPPGDLESHGYSSNPPSRSMSFSGSESEPFRSGLVRPHLDDDDETSQSDDCDSPVTSVSDCGESPSPLDEANDCHDHDGVDEDFEDEFPAAQFPEDAFDAFDFSNDTPTSDTPTPRQETIASCYLEYKSSVSRRFPSPQRRSPSPSPKHHFTYRREGSSLKDIRRSPDEALSKVQKTMADSSPHRRRPGCRRRLD